MRAIVAANALYYYDGINVFDARDAIGGHYVGVLVEDTRAGARKYLVVGVTPENLSRFRLGEIDLRGLLENRPEAEWFTAETLDDLDQPLPLQPRDGAIPEDYMPQPGFVLHSFASSIQSSAVLAEAVARRKVVMDLAVDSSESAQAHKVRANVLGGLLINLQTLLKRAYARVMRELSQASKKLLDADIDPLLDVVASPGHGSLRLRLEPAQAPDLFGSSEVTEALAVVDEIIAVAADPDETLVRVRKYRGHTARAYMRLLRFLVEAHVSMEYAWASPDREEVSRHGISRADAEPLVAALTTSEDLGREIRTLVGPLRKVDMDAGTWRLKATEDDKDYSGEVRVGVSLSGLVTGRTYRFVCDEEIEQVPGMVREAKTLYLTGFSEVT